jgi:lysophospholipase L1-like esterase
MREIGHRHVTRYAAQHRITFVDYWTPMAREQQGLPPALSPDGVHPNEAGYRMMAPLVERGIAAALRRR